MFYGSFAALVVVAAATVLVPATPVGLVTTAVQALAGVLLPSAAVFLLPLCNDREVLGPWTNPRWLNALATLIVGGLLALSALLTVTTLLPRVRVRLVAKILLGLLALGLASAAAAASSRRRRGGGDPEPAGDRLAWRMPVLELLPAPARSRTFGLVVLRVYLTFAAALIVVKVVELIGARRGAPSAELRDPLTKG